MNRLLLLMSAFATGALLSAEPAYAACCDWNAGVHGDLVESVELVSDSKGAHALKTMDFGSTSKIWRLTPSSRMGLTGRVFDSPMTPPAARTRSTLSSTNTASVLSGGDLNLNYFTPRMSGFQAGLSLTPEHVKTTPDYQTRFNTRPGQLQNVVIFSGSYEKEIAGVQLGLSAAYGQADLEAVRFSTQQDPDKYSFGASVGLKGFTVAGSFSQANNFSTRIAPTATANFAEKNWDVGLSYESGNWTFAGAYGRANRQIPGLNKAGTHNSAEGGVNYTLGSGISLGLMGVYFDYETTNKVGKVMDSNAGAAAMFETGVEF